MDVFLWTVLSPPFWTASMGDVDLALQVPTLSSLSRPYAPTDRMHGCYRAWTLFSPEEPNTRLGDRFEEKILLLVSVVRLAL